MSVAVITPNYNAAPYLAQCLASVADDPAVSEIIVYDNASTDNSLQILAEAGVDKLKILKGENNIGATAARHLAIASSESEFVFLLDADDFVSPGAVSQARDVAIAEHLDLALLELWRATPEGVPDAPFVAAPQRILDGRTAFKMTIGGWRIHSCGVLRKSVYKAAASAFVFHGHSDDELLTRRILLQCSRIGGSPGTYFYRQLPKSRGLKQIVAQVRTEVGVLKLTTAVEWEDDTPLLRMRNGLARACLSLALKAGRGLVPADDVKALAREYGTVKLRWRAEDAPYFAADRLVRLFALLRR